MSATTKRSVEERCRHCKAPGRSNLQGPPLLKNYEQKNFLIETDQYNIKHYYDQEKKQLPKGWKAKAASKTTVKSISLENPLVQSWSGFTFMTEHENRNIEKRYQERLMDSQIDRKVWRTFKKKINKHHANERLTTAGPEWFQEMSTAQMNLVDNFEPALKQDLTERHSGRSQDFLYELGVWPEVAPNLVARAVKRSLGSVISFIFKIHQEVTAMETPEYEKKFAEAKRLNMSISMYSINERILLTAVFHYHFPTLLEKLDQMLPPPYEEPIVMWAKKPPEKKKIYASPYLEPLPINTKPWYVERAEEELERKVLLKIKRQKERRERMEEQDKIAGEAKMLRRRGLKKKDSDLKSDKTKIKSMEFCGRVFSVFGEDDLACLPILPHRERKSLFFKKYTEQITSFIDNREDEESETRKTSEESTSSEPRSPEKRSAVVTIVEPTVTKKQEDVDSGTLSDLSLKMLTEHRTDKARKSIVELMIDNAKLLDNMYCGKGGPYLTRCLLDTEAEHICEEIRVIKAPSMNSPKSSSCSLVGVEEFKRKDSTLPLDISYKELTSVTRISAQGEDVAMRMSGPPLPDTMSMSLAIAKPPQSKVPGKEHMMKKPYTVECTEPQCGIVEDLEKPLSDFELARRRIAILPPKMQLQAAIKFLSEKGDPLAILPQMEEVPWLVRWLDKRRGIKRTLTPEDNDELLSRSQAIWNCRYTLVTEAPMVDIPEGNFNWGQKKKLVKKVNKRVDDHQRAIKHIMIDNARDLFPSMFSEYYSGRLNKSFRDTFYAYFPARERDCLVVRPWNPHGDDKKKLTV